MTDSDPNGAVPTPDPTDSEQGLMFESLLEGGWQRDPETGQIVNPALVHQFPPELRDAMLKGNWQKLDLKPTEPVQFPIAESDFTQLGGFARIRADYTSLLVDADGTAQQSDTDYSLTMMPDQVGSIIKTNPANLDTLPEPLKSILKTGSPPTGHFDEAGRVPVKPLLNREEWKWDSDCKAFIHQETLAGLDRFSRAILLSGNLVRGQGSFAGDDEIGEGGYDPNERIKVFVCTSSAIPNYPLIATSLRGLEDAMESFFPDDIWLTDMDDDHKLTISFAYMTRAEVAALEEWSP